MKLTNLVLFILLTPFLTPACNIQPDSQPPVPIKKVDAGAKPKKQVDAVVYETVVRAPRLPLPDTTPEGFKVDNPFEGCETYDVKEGKYVLVDFMKGCWYWTVAIAVVVSSPNKPKKVSTEAAKIMLEEIGSVDGMRLILNSVTKDPQGKIYPVVIFGVPRAVRI